MTTDIAAMTPQDVAKAANDKLAELKGSIPDRIETDESAADTEQIMKNVGRLGSRLKTRRMEITAPSRERTAEVNDLIMPVEKDCEMVKKYGKSKLLVFQREQIAIEHKRQEKIRQEQEAEAARLREEAAKKSVAPDFKTQAEARRQETQATEVESREVVAKPRRTFDQRSLKTSWRAEVIDLLEVPAMHKIADQKALDALARESDGKNPPPGVKFVEKI